MAFGDLSQPRHQQIGLSVLKHESTGSGIQSVKEVIVTVEGRKDNDLDVTEFPDSRGGLDAVHDGHLNIHKNDVRSSLPHHVDRLNTIGRLRDHRDVRLGCKNETKSLSDQFLVVLSLIHI